MESTKKSRTWNKSSPRTGRSTTLSLARCVHPSAAGAARLECWLSARCVNCTSLRQMDSTNQKLSSLMDTQLNASVEDKKQRNLELLQRQFPGVFGRLSDLVKPKQRKYNLAVSTVGGKHCIAACAAQIACAKLCHLDHATLVQALSKHMDAIVVESQSTVRVSRACPDSTFVDDVDLSVDSRYICLALTRPLKWHNT